MIRCGCTDSDAHVFFVTIRLKPCNNGYVVPGYLGSTVQDTPTTTNTATTTAATTTTTTTTTNI